MNNLLRTLILVITVMLSPFAHATYSCTGPISYLAVNTGGAVYVSIGNGVWTICVLHTASNGVAPETCRAWYAGLLAAQKAGHSVTLYFNTGTCETIGSWVTVTPNLYHMDLLGN